MDRFLHLYLCGYICTSALLILRYGYLAATESTGPRKGRSILIATLAFASCFVVLPLLQMLEESSLPKFELEGAVTSVRIIDSSSKHFSAYVSLATTLGGSTTLHVSDRSEGWRVGQHLRVRYYGDSGELIQAALLDSHGNVVGHANRTAALSRGLSIFVGVFLSWSGYVRYRRAPLGDFESESDSEVEANNPLNGEDSSSEKVLASLRTNAHEYLTKQLHRTLLSSTALAASCLLVWPFLAGYPLHRYWDSTGKYLVMIAMVLVLPFAASLALSVSAWLSYRNAKRLAD